MPQPRLTSLALVTACMSACASLANTFSTGSFPAPGPAAYPQFHGMLCGRSVAAACVPSFDGTIVFMPSTYDPSSFLTATEQRTLLPYEVTKLTVIKYYFLARHATVFRFLPAPMSVHS